MASDPDALQSISRACGVRQASGPVGPGGVAALSPTGWKRGRTTEAGGSESAPPWGALDSIASNAIVSNMSTTLTIRNLDESVKQKLRMRAARNQTSMEAEARAILARMVNEEDTPRPPQTVGEMRARLAALRGAWKNRANGRGTDEIMKELRGDD